MLGSTNINIITFAFLHICLFSRAVNHRAPYTDPHCEGKQVIVHLFEWKWTDIAQECEAFLADAGYCGVQVSPVNEHIISMTPYRPWWESYQPVSYKLTSRRGTEVQFTDMVQRCNDVGVRVYVDVQMNHMAASNQVGNGTAGSFYNTAQKYFPGVPYSRQHFTPRGLCPSNDGTINDYSDANNIRNCDLVGLTDLYLSLPYVRQKIISFLNRLIQIGVAGFRLDAAKHMWPNDVKYIMRNVMDLPSGGRPFVYSEVIDNGGEAISAQEYTDFGYVTEFRYCTQINNAVRSFDKFSNLIDPRLNMLDSDHAFVFVDNHDNQRGHGTDGSIVTFKEPYLYKMAVAFTLAYDYGFARVMSSYNFTSFDQGPPHNDDGTIENITYSTDGKLCTHGRVCEHRWPEVASMVDFRNKMSGLPASNFQVSSSFVSFSRGDKGFFVMAKSGVLDKWIYTGLPGGFYCDLISPDCERYIAVDKNSRSRLIFWPEQQNIMAFVVGGRVPRQPSIKCKQTAVNSVPPSLPRRWKRTVILIRVETQFGQNVFLRGGIDHSKRQGCGPIARISQCAIPIRYNIPVNSPSFNAWAEGDEYLDWGGREPYQNGVVNGVKASGTPLLWTTNDERSGSYNALNIYGPNYWLFDVEMDCDRTYNGWFEFKALIDNSWEDNIRTSSCDTSSPPYDSSNHFAKCGHFGVFKWSQSDCSIIKLS